MNPLKRRLLFTALAVATIVGGCMQPDAIMVKGTPRGALGFRGSVKAEDGPAGANTEKQRDFFREFVLLNSLCNE